MESFWVESFRYNKWANLQLLASCSGLTTAQLRLTAPGTYGTIADTFLHLLGAEERYIRRLTNEEPTLSEKSDFPGIGALTDHATRTGDVLISLSQRVKPGEILETKYQDRPYRMQAGVVLIQALHHGNDHRTHICTILGSNALPYTDMDVWSYGEASGAMGYVEDA
ncbi:MAG: DinB family protein [Candidatus Dormibacteraceae bacterium]